MNNENSIKIIARFYEALDVIVASKQIRGVKTFTDMYDINRWNFNTVRKNPQSDMFQMSWVAHIITDFGVSAEWIMTGNGWMFGTENYIPIKKEKPE